MTVQYHYDPRKAFRQLREEHKLSLEVIAAEARVDMLKAHIFDSIGLLAVEDVDCLLEALSRLTQQSYNRSNVSRIHLARASLMTPPHTFAELLKLHDIALGAVAAQAGVDLRTAAMMAQGESLFATDVDRLLQALSHLTGETYNQENVEGIRIFPEFEGNAFNHAASQRILRS